MSTEPRTRQIDRDVAVCDAQVRELVNGLVHALPEIVLGKSRQPDARSRADDFARAFATRRAA